MDWINSPVTYVYFQRIQEKINQLEKRLINTKFSSDPFDIELRTTSSWRGRRSALKEILDFEKLVSVGDEVDENYSKGS